MDKKKKIKLLSDIDVEEKLIADIEEEKEEEWNEKSADEMESGDDLDIPGAELDDLMEDVGSEDEENNYYSIGGDRHHSLEE